jgi:hypothetical protein
MGQNSSRGNLCLPKPGPWHLITHHYLKLNGPLGFWPLTPELVGLCNLTAISHIVKPDWAHYFEEWTSHFFRSKVKTEGFSCALLLGAGIVLIHHDWKRGSLETQPEAGMGRRECGYPGALSPWLSLSKLYSTWTAVKQNSGSCPQGKACPTIPIGLLKFLTFLPAQQYIENNANCILSVNLRYKVRSRFLTHYIMWEIEMPVIYLINSVFGDSVCSVLRACMKL